MSRTIDGTRTPMASFFCTQVDTATHIPKGPHGQTGPVWRLGAIWD
jgi:hypothetical protein